MAKMKIRIPDYILSLQPYSPGKPIEELEREYGIKDSVKLASNENPIGPSPLAVRAITSAIGKINRYPDGGAYVLVRKIAAHLSVMPENIILGNGSDEIIGMITRVFVQPGDEVIIPKPSFLMYDIMVKSAGATPVYSPLSSFAIDLADIERRITSKTRVIFICNPNNPTGTVILKPDFEKFIKSIPENILVVVDEAYIEFVQEKNCAFSMDYFDNSTAMVTLRTFSKAYGLAGLRIGYGIMPAPIADVLNRIRQPFNAGILAQQGAIAAIDDVDFLNQTKTLIRQGLDFLYQSLDSLSIKYFPSETNFFLIDVGTRADNVFKRLLQKGVIVRSMTSYGYPEYIRINVGLEQENQKFIESLKQVLADLKNQDMPSDLIITIDGPSGAGKTTLSKIIADRLGYKYVDTGALYRGIAFEAMSEGLSHDDDDSLKMLCSRLTLNFVYETTGLRLYSNGVDITDKIRTPEVTMFASAVSARPVVRKYLLKLQKDIGRKKRAVFEGRDMGTVVFPEADIKFYLIASTKVRAYRRYKELSSISSQTLQEVERDIIKRDENDSTRSLAPLKPAKDAICIDSSELSIDEVVSLIMSHIQT
jgi:histidinol-phosphate aminotransferase